MTTYRLDAETKELICKFPMCEGKLGDIVVGYLDTDGRRMVLDVNAKTLEQGQELVEIKTA